MTYLTFPTPAETDAAAIASIGASIGARSVTVLGDRHGQTVLIGAHADGCRTAILLRDNGDGTVRAWPETDLGNIGWHASTARGHHWFLDPADLANLGVGCAQHTSEHWRAEHRHAVEPVLAA